MEPSATSELSSAIIGKAREEIQPHLHDVAKSYSGPRPLFLMVQIAVEAALLKVWVAGFVRGLAMGRASVKTEKAP